MFKMNKKKFWDYPVRHVSVDIFAYSETTFNSVTIWIENEQKKSPRGFHPRSYVNVSKASMKRLSIHVMMLKENPTISFSQKSMTTFFWEERLKKDQCNKQLDVSASPE